MDSHLESKKCWLVSFRTSGLLDPQNLCKFHYCVKEKLMMIWIMIVELVHARHAKLVLLNYEEAKYDVCDGIKRKHFIRFSILRRL
jgi:hypothetical protein